MKKKQLLSIILSLLLLSALLPTAAFATTVLDNPTGTAIAELASGDDMNINDGTITANRGTVNTNNGTVTDNIGTVTANVGTVANNYGTVGTNTGTVTNNFGAATVSGLAAEHQFWEVTVKGGDRTTNTLVTGIGKLWIEDTTGSASFSPVAGYTISNATATNGTITSANGKWTLTGVTADTTVTLTVAAVPKTGVNRDTGLLITLALISGAVLVTALPRKKKEG